MNEMAQNVIYSLGTEQSQRLSYRSLKLSEKVCFASLFSKVSNQNKPKSFKTFMCLPSRAVQIEVNYVEKGCSWTNERTMQKRRSGPFLCVRFKCKYLQSERFFPKKVNEYLTFK